MKAVKRLILHEINASRGFQSYSRRLAKQKAAEKSKYSHTVLLPKTDFPAKLAGKKRTLRDEEIAKVMGFSSLYSWQKENRSQAEEFVLHDGPPYANGSPHMGHALNKILKDIVCRYYLLSGRRVDFIPGWDCHGLPIELKAQANKKENSTISPLKLRRRAAAVAEKEALGQKKAFEHWGVMADWNHPYYTNSVSYVTKQLHLFLDFYEKGFIYRDLKPVYWSPSSRTALAEAELEYNAEHVSPSVYVRFPCSQLSARIPNAPDSSSVGLLIWTTTPWSLPANTAVCYHPDFTYCLVQETHEKYYLVIAQELKESIEEKLKRSLKVVSTFPGVALEGCTYHHPLRPQIVLPVLPAQHVTLSKGTGLVHTAPAHGPDDFLVAKIHNLSISCPVDEEGVFTDEAGKELAGLSCLGEGGEAVLRLLGSKLLSQELYTHSYPYDWRTKKPVIIRASQQWFFDTSKIKQRALELLDDVSILPSGVGRGMSAMVSSRPFWCISRQRVWGVPIPVFYNKHSGEPLINRSIVEHLSLLLKEDPDAWWTLSTKELLPKQLIEEYGPSAVDDYVPGKDILDIWMDSGVSWHTVLNDKPADVYLEGIDQFRGWFQSSLLTSVAARDAAPYRNLLVHGFVLDEEGRKMSKSLGNVFHPQQVTHGDKALGVDVLRWWTAQHGVGSMSVEVGPSLLSSVSDTLQKIRLVLRFLLSSLQDFNCDSDSVSLHEMLLLDRYMLHLLHQYVTKCDESYKEMSLNHVCQSTVHFTASSVSALYFNLVKDRLYCDPRASVRRRSAQTVLNHLLDYLSLTLGPILPHLIEEVHLHHPRYKGSLSAFRRDWTLPPDSWINPSINDLMEALLNVRDCVNKRLPSTNLRKWQATMVATGKHYKFLQAAQDCSSSYDSDLCELLQVSRVDIGSDPDPQDVHVHVNDELQVYLQESSGNQCSRCRRFCVEDQTDLCSRCDAVVSSIS